ncbi:RAD51-associated protein 1 isoform X2 [Betta splendens]|uniref:RAD51-associated protein 1 isoform X2 n=1 Tax=Betta splendens TaxID=158456 RepID=A0A6P7NJI9_BETSP|nr:RAD51-associated protein 1 isoform X2 [Betta splendens]
MDRPSRRSKIVNYCETKNSDDDEDFAPPSKKAKEDVKQQDSKKLSRKSSSQETNSQSTLSQKRKPLDENLHNRDLEAAITLSLLNNADGIQDQCSVSKDVKIQLPVDESTDSSSTYLSNCSVDSSSLGLNEITSVKKSSPSGKRNPATDSVEEQIKKVEEDEDYQPKLTPESESDFTEPDESEEEEFTVKKVSKTKKGKVKKNEKIKQPPVSKKEKKSSKAKSQSAASTPVRSPPAAKCAPKRPASSSTAPVSKSTVPLSPAGGRLPKWNPPGQIGKSPTSCQNPVKSPGQGLRLGLSRLVRVKPLHPSVVIH